MAVPRGANKLHKLRAVLVESSLEGAASEKPYDGVAGGLSSFPKGQQQVEAAGATKISSTICMTDKSLKGDMIYMIGSRGNTAPQRSTQLCQEQGWDWWGDIKS